MLRRLLTRAIVFALLLSAFFILNVPALFYAPDAAFLLQVVRLLILLLLLVVTVRVTYLLVVLAFPKTSRTVRKLARLGSRAALLADANEEYMKPHILDQDNMVLTPKYLFKFAGDRSAIVPLQSVLWVYEFNNMRRSFSTGRERMVYFLRVVTIAGDTIQFASLYQKNIQKVVDTLTERYPNFFYGYSEEHDKMVSYILRENKIEAKRK